jgi:hypothetical protein
LYRATPGSFVAEVGLRCRYQDADRSTLAVRAKESVFDPSNLKLVIYIVMDSRRRNAFLGMPFVFPLNPDPVCQIFMKWD